MKQSTKLDDSAVRTLSRAIFVSALHDWREVKKYNLDSYSPIFRDVINFFNSSFCEDILNLLFPDYEPDKILRFIRHLEFPKGNFSPRLFSQKEFTLRENCPLRGQ